MRRVFAALGTCGLTIGLAAAGDPPNPPPSVSELVARLGSGDFREREAATAALHKAGPGAIPALREAARSDDPEVRQRAAGVLVRLQRAADSAALLAPKKIALNYRDMPLGTAVNDLAARTGVKLALDPTRIADPLRRVTCATAEVPVWEALDRFCAAAGLTEAHRADLEVPKQALSRRGWANLPSPPAPDAVPVVLIDGTARLPGARDTAVRVVPLPRTFPGHRVTLGTGEFTLCLDVAPLPGLGWQEVIAVRVTKLTDDAGRPGGGGTSHPAPAAQPTDVVVAWGGGGPGGFAVAGGLGGRIDPRTGMPIPPDSLPNPRVIALPLKLDTPTAKSLKRLEGYVVGEIAVPNQSLIAVDDPAKRTGVPLTGPGGVRLTVNSVTEAKGGGTAIQVTLQQPSPWAVSARRGFNPGGMWPESPRAGDALPTVKAYDAAGKELSGAASSISSNSSDDGQSLIQSITLTFRKGVTPAKLAVVGPRPVVVEVPFVLENVPLP